MRTLIYNTLRIGLLAVLAVSPALAEDAELDSAKAAFGKSLENLRTDRANNLRTWPARYVKALTTIQKKMQSAGNLEGWQSTDKEIKRFKSHRRLSELDVDGESREIAKLQRDFLKMRGEYESSHARLVLGLRDRYVSHLTGLQKRRTQAGNIEDALRVKEEVDRVNASEAVSAAEFTVADETARTESGSPPASEDRDESQAPRTAEVTKSKEGITIYAAGKIPPKLTGAVLRRISLAKTDYSPLKSKVSVTYWEHNSASNPKRNKKEEHRVRLGIRGSGLNIKNRNEGLRVTVQYYLKRDKQEPQKFKTVHSGLPALQTGMIHIDFPTVTPVIAYHKRRPWQRNSYIHGKYYGCIVSIWDRSGSLLYQGCSKPQLKAHAQAKP